MWGGGCNFTDVPATSLPNSVVFRAKRPNVVVSILFQCTSTGRPPRHPTLNIVPTRLLAMRFAAKSFVAASHDDVASMKRSENARQHCYGTPRTRVAAVIITIIIAIIILRECVFAETSSGLPRNERNKVRARRRKSNGRCRYESRRFCRFERVTVGRAREKILAIRKNRTVRFRYWIPVSRKTLLKSI